MRLLLSLFYLFLVLSGSFLTAEAAPTLNVLQVKERHYTGTAGKARLRLCLLQRGDSLTGYYYKPDAYSLTLLRGRKHGSDSFTLCEDDKRYQVFAFFKGQFQREGAGMKGNWRIVDGSVEEKWNLTEETAERRITYDLQCYRDREKTITPLPGSGLDVELERVILTGGGTSQAVRTKINTTLDAQLLQDLPDVANPTDKTSLPAFGRQFMQRYRPRLSESTPTPPAPVVYYAEELALMRLNAHNLLCVQTAGAWDIGDKHPFAFQRFQNFDTRTGELLKLDMLLKKGYLDELEPKVEAAFRAAHGLGPKDIKDIHGYHYFNSGPFRMPEQFYLTPEGIGFYYNEYEVAPYNAGATDILIPYSELTDYIDPAGLLGWAVK